MLDPALTLRRTLWYQKPSRYDVAEELATTIWLRAQAIEVPELRDESLTVLRPFESRGSISARACAYFAGQKIELSAARIGLPSRAQQMSSGPAL